MKSSNFIAVLTMALLFTGSILAQPGNRPQKERRDTKRSEAAGFQGLTEEQKSKVKEIRIAYFKETQELRNKMGELKARQKTLTTVQKPDMKAIEGNIDEISKVQNQMMKRSAAMHQQVRALLTDEQKLRFDMRPMKKAHQKGMVHNRNYRYNRSQVELSKS